MVVFIEDGGRLLLRQHDNTLSTILAKIAEAVLKLNLIVAGDGCKAEATFKNHRERQEYVKTNPKTEYKTYPQVEAPATDLGFGYTFNLSTA